MTITCGIQPTNVVTIAIKVLYNSSNLCTIDLTDMYALALWPVAPPNCHMVMLMVEGITNLVNIVVF